MAVAILLRTFVVTAYWVVNDSVSPELPSGSYAVVFKLARTHRPGDIIVYHEDGRAKLARVAKAGPTAEGLLVERAKQPPCLIPTASIAGKVILNTRPLGARKEPPAGGMR